MQKQIKRAIAENLRAHRIENNLSQKQFAKLVGLKKCTIAAYEEQRAIPPFVTLLKLSHVLSISIYQLTKTV
jgi:transcriptional regulator with XRE-family HTH domain